MGDFTEGKLYQLINDGDYRAISFYLSTMCKDRGYVLRRGTALTSEVTNNVTIGEVRIVSVPSGRYLAEPLGALIEPDAEPKLN